MAKKIKIKTLLIISFTWILMLMILLGGASVFFTRRLANQTIDFYEFPHAVQLNVAEITIDLHRISGSIKEAMVYRTSEQTKKTTDTVSNTLSDMNAKIELVNSAFKGETVLLENADAALKVWLSENDKLRALMEEKKYDEAITLFENSYLAAENNAETAISKISEAASSFTQSYYENAKRSKFISVRVIITVVIIAIATMLLACVVILRSIGIPLQMVRKAAGEMARGNLRQHVGFDGNNEFGELAQSMDAIVDTLSEYVGNIGEVLGRLSNNDMTVQVEREYIGDFAPIKVSMEQIAHTLNHAMTEISQCAEQVYGGSEQVSASAQILSQGASEQASSSEALSTSLNEISGQVRQTADYTEQANELVTQVGTRLEQGNQQMREMLSAMSEINSASDQIAKIIKTIEDIAFQTNILALNAAVEAARAGEAGKGFAVVAGEVRNLAGKSAEAAKSTTVLIQNTIEAVSNGTKLADDTAQTLGSVVSGARDITDMVSKLADTAEEQAASIEQVSDAVSQISNVIQTNSATSEECAATSGVMREQAQALKALVERYKLR